MPWERVNTEFGTGVLGIELSDLFNVVEENSKSVGFFSGGIVLLVSSLPGTPKVGDRFGSGGGGNRDESEKSNSKDNLGHWSM